jgi:hypothetical protein
MQLFKAGHFALAAALTGVAVCASAVAAHVGIDIAGDVVLAHDTYDGVAHASRGEMMSGAALGIGFVLLWLVRAALERTRVTHGMRLTVDDVLGRGPHRFVFAVVGLSIPMLATMECFDITASGGGVDGVADLLGGSIALGLGLTTVIAAAIALIVRRIARFALDSREALARIIGQFFTLLTRAVAPCDASRSECGVGLQIGQRSILSRRSGKRGPPLPA